MADITHLVGLADASKGPSEFGKVLSFIQPPSHGAAAYELVSALPSPSMLRHAELSLQDGRGVYGVGRWVSWGAIVRGSTAISN